MPNAMLFLFALLSCVLGFAWLALTMEPHWRQVQGNQVLSKQSARILRLLGWLALLITPAICLLADHPSMAVLVWVMTLAAAAVIVAFTFTWQPRMFAPLVAWIRQ